MSPCFTVYEAGTPLNWDGVTKVFFLNIANKNLMFCWVPRHIGIRGNEKADSAAKSELDLPRFKIGVPKTDFKHHINQYIVFT